MPRVTASAPGKINLTLEVVRRLANGYHEIRSVFLRTDRLADAITVDLDRTRLGVTISATTGSVPLDASNICHRATTCYLQAVDTMGAVHVHIDKNLPVAAGMGGGSSDAAAVLLALNALYADALGPADLAQLGADIGKDVPFFLSGEGAAYVTGMGEIVEPLPGAPRLSTLIVNPGIAVPTPAAYALLDTHLAFMADEQRVDLSRVMARALQEDDVPAIAAALYNDFEIAIQREHPAIKELKQMLRAFGALGALMSGSGSTVFGIFEDAPAVQFAESALRRRYPSIFVAAG